MEIQYKGEKYKVKYIHHRQLIDGKIQAKGGITEAFITDKKTKEVIANGQAFVSYKDTYQKKLGRIIATGRLMKSLGIPRNGIQKSA